MSQYLSILSLFHLKHVLCFAMWLKGEDRRNSYTNKIKWNLNYLTLNTVNNYSKCCNSRSNRTLDHPFFLLKVNFHFADADAGTDFLYNLASAGPSLTFIELAPRTPEDRGYNEAVRIMHKLYLAGETTCFILLSISVLLLSFPFYTADCGELFDNFTKLCFYCIQFSRSKEFVYWIN